MVPRMSLKILHGISSIEAEKGGPSSCVRALCEELAGAACQVTLLSAFYGAAPSEVAACAPAELRLVKGWSVLGRGFAPAMDTWLRRNARRYDLIHSNGMWMPQNMYLRRAAVRAGKPLVISPHGMLSGAALKRSAWKKAVARRLYEDANLRAADLFHVTSMAELQSIRDWGLRQPVAVIPHGVSLTEFTPPQAEAMEERRNVVYLGRLHPHKGLSALLEAWSLLNGESAGWQLVIGGPGPRRYRRKLEGQVAALGLKSSVGLCGPVYGKRKVELLKGAHVLALPSESENFGLVVAEALACGTPVVATRGAPWQDLEERRCGWWVEGGARPLAAALKEAMSLCPAERAEMGRRGRSLVEAKYARGGAAGRMMEVYQWLCGAGPRPRCVAA